MKNTLKLLISVGILIIFISVSIFVSDAVSSVDYFNEGNSLLNSGKTEEAIQSYNKAIELNSEIPEYHYNKGVALLQLGKYDEAIVSFDSSIELAPEFKEPYINKIVCLLQTNKAEEALETSYKCLEFYPNDSYTYI